MSSPTYRVRRITIKGVPGGYKLIASPTGNIDPSSFIEVWLPPNTCETIAKEVSAGSGEKPMVPHDWRGWEAHWDAIIEANHV